MTKLVNLNKDEYESKYGRELHAIIDKDGTVYQSDDFITDIVKMITFKYDIPVNVVLDMCPYTKHIDVISWLCITAEVACVTSTSIWFYTLAEAQIVSLQKLKFNDMYLGEIPYSHCN